MVMYRKFSNGAGGPSLSSMLIIIIGKYTISFMQDILHIFLRQTMSLMNTMLQLFSRYCLWRSCH
jgi:hypothetical protein